MVSGVKKVLYKLNITDAKQRILELVNQIEWFCEYQKSYSVSYEDGTFSSICTDNIQKNSIRLIYDNKLGFFNFNGSLDDLENLLRDTLNEIKYGKKAMPTFSKPINNVKTNPQIFDQKVTEIGIDYLKEICVEIRNYIGEHSSNVECDIVCESSTKNIELLNSNGFALGYSKTGYFISFWLKKNFFGENKIIFDSLKSLKFIDFRPTVDQLLKELSWEEKPKYNKLFNNSLYILAPSIIGYIINTVFSAIDAQVINQGLSFIDTLSGKQILKNKLSIYDDGIKDWGMNSSPFDDEGTLTTITPIFENGYFKKSIADLQYAWQYRLKATGNGRKKFGFTMPNTNNIKINLNKSNEKDIFNEVPRCVYIGTAAVDCNINGNFTIYPQNSYVVEEGNIVGRLSRNFILRGRILDLLNNIISVSDDVKIIRYNMSMPYVLIDGMNFYSN